MNQEIQFENESFADIMTFDVGPLEAGSHWLILMAWDSKDNMDMLSFSLAVQPGPGVDVRIWNVSYLGTPVVGQTLEINAVIQNLGGDSATGRLCSDEVCSQIVNLPWATSMGPGVVEVTLEVPLEDSGDLPLRFDWGSSSLNQEESVVIESNIVVNPNSGPLQVVLGVFMLIAGLAIGARFLWGQARD